MLPPLLVFGPSFWYLATLLLNSGDGPDLDFLIPLKRVPYSFQLKFLIPLKKIYCI